MSPARRWRAVWTLLILASGIYFLSDNEADNDLWVHVRLGVELLATGVPRVDAWSYTVAGAPVIDHEWLMHAVFGALHGAGGGPALLLFKLGIGLATLGLLAVSVARRTRSVHVRGVVLLLATAVLARGFAVRPQIVTTLGVAALWAFLDARALRDSPLRWLLVPAFVLWANLHGGVVLGLAMTGLCAAWAIFDRRREAVRLGIAVAAGVVAVLIFNPYGLTYADFLVRELGAPHPITEWQPAAFEPAQATFFLLAAAFLAAVPWLRQWRERGWEALLAGALLVAALGQQRHTPVFALCAAPLVAEGIDAVLSRLRGRWTLSAGAQGLLAAGLVALALVQLFLAVARLGRDRLQIVFAPAEYPVQAVRALAASGGAAMNLAVPLEWGGYAAWHLGPRVKVSLDGRFAMVYPPAVVEDNFAFFSGRDQWRRLIDAYDTDAVLAPSGELPPVAGSADWRAIHRDPVATVLVRKDSPLAAAPPPPERPAGVFP